MSRRPPARQRLEVELRDELIALTERDFAAADALEAAGEEDPQLAQAIEALLDDPATAFIAALADWDAAPPVARRLVEVTSENLARLAAIVGDGGWPGLTRVGAVGTDAAWIIAHHADAANEVRAHLVEPLRAAVAAGEADPRHLAMLIDRIAAVEGAPQTYGTILAVREDGEPDFPVPVAEPAGLAERRTALGLPAVADELPHRSGGADLIPFGPDRRRSPLLAWPTVLEGQASVAAALEARVRDVHAILAVRPGDRRLRRLRALAGERGVKVRAVDEELIDELASGGTHGGVVATVGSRRYLALDELLAGLAADPLLVLLDGIEDPYNFGQAIRAAYAAGIDGLVVGPRSWENAAGVVARASAGTSELLPSARVDGIEAAVDACRGAGLKVACATNGADARPVGEVDLRRGALLVVGGERRGINRGVLDRCDVEVTIPYGRAEAPPLGSAAAAAILAFEALRQRRSP